MDYIDKSYQEYYNIGKRYMIKIFLEGAIHEN